jgi:hypothetical protein
MTAADTPGSTEPLLPAHADFTKFTAYLENSAADPRLSPVQTALTRHVGRGLPLPGPLAARPTLPMLVRIAPEIPALLRLTAHPATVKAERMYPMRRDRRPASARRAADERMRVRTFGGGCHCRPPAVSADGRVR